MFEKFKNTPLTSIEVILVFPDPQMYQQIPLTAALKIYLFEKNRKVFRTLSNIDDFCKKRPIRYLTGF